MTQEPTTDGLIADVNRLADYILSLDCGYPKQGGAIDTAIQMITDFQQENGRLLKVIERLGSSEAFGNPMFLDHKTNEGRELVARIDYAREALATEPKETV